MSPYDRNRKIGSTINLIAEIFYKIFQISKEPNLKNEYVVVKDIFCRPL